MTESTHHTTDHGAANGVPRGGLEQVLFATGDQMRGAMDKDRPFGPNQLRSLRLKLADEPARGGFASGGDLLPGSPAGRWITLWRRALLGAAALFILGAIALAVVSVPLRASFSGRVQFAAGDGTIVPADGALYTGTQLATTGEGGIEFDVGPHASLYLGKNSRVVIDGPDQITLESGVVWTSVRPGHGAFRVATATATVHVVGTAFEVSADEGVTAVDLVKGRVEIESAVDGARRPMEAGRAMRITGAGMTEHDGHGAPPAWVVALNRASLAKHDLIYFPSATVLDGEDEREDRRSATPTTTASPYDYGRILRHGE